VYLVAGLMENRHEVNMMASGGTRVQSQGAEPGCRARVQSQGAEPGCRARVQSQGAEPGWR
jgi:hypothetical protein